MSLTREELLPCPFCGSEDVDPKFGYFQRPAEEGGDTYGHEPGCNACGASAPADVWNRRALTARSEGFREDAGQEWRVTENGNLICSEDFTFDAMLKLDGDFADEAQRIQYAEAIAGKLNALSPRETDASSPPPPERP